MVSAIASIISELLGTVLLVVAAKRLLGGMRPEWSRLGRIALATVPALAALILVPPSVSVWIRIPMGASLYLLAVVLFGGVATTEIRSALRREAPRKPRIWRAAAGGTGRTSQRSY